MNDIIEDMEIEKTNCDNYFVQFNKGNYKNCRNILREMLTNNTRDKDRTLTDSILRNNIVVCKAMELISEEKSILYLKNELQNLLKILNSIPEMCVDANLCFVYNYLALFNQEKFRNNSQDQFIVDLEEQIASILSNLHRVLDGSCGKSRLDQIHLAFQISYTSFEHLDARQAFVLIAIRVLIALSAQHEFVMKITCKNKDEISLPMEMLHQVYDRTKQIPIFLMPIIHGHAFALRDMDINQGIQCLNLVFSALLTRVRKFKPALNCLSTSYEDANHRALAIYIRAYTQSSKLDSLKLLDTVFAMREGREGELGCRARILQANLVSHSGRKQQAVNILRAATKKYGDQWILLENLATLYLQLNQDEAYLRSLELLLQCLMTSQNEIVSAKFQDKVLKILHPDETPSVAQTLYKIANVHHKMKRYDAASDRMLQLLARQDDLSLSVSLNVSLRNIVRETAWMLLQADRLEEATVVCNRAVAQDLSEQEDHGSDWSDKNLKMDVISVMLLARIHEAAQKYHEALEDLNNCVRKLQGLTEKSQLMGKLMARCLLQIAQIYSALKDDANTKHAYIKAVNFSKDREVLLLYSRYLLSRGDENSTLQFWLSNEKICSKCDAQYNDRILNFLLAPNLSGLQLSELENEIKMVIVKSRK